MKTYNDNKAVLTNTRTEQSVEAECDNFREGQRFDAYIATNKIPMRWNGKVYVGNMHGMEFTSVGPKLFTRKETKR